MLYQEALETELKETNIMLEETQHSKVRKSDFFNVVSSLFQSPFPLVIDSLIILRLGSYGMLCILLFIYFSLSLSLSLSLHPLNHTHSWNNM